MAGGVVGVHENLQVLRGFNRPSFCLKGGGVFIVSGLRDLDCVARKEGGHPTDER